MTKQGKNDGNDRVGAVKGVTRVVVHNARHLAEKAKDKLAKGGK